MKHQAHAGPRHTCPEFHRSWVWEILPVVLFRKLFHPVYSTEELDEWNAGMLE